MEIKTVIDHVRGCGTRKPGGLYFVSDGLMTACGRLPIRLERCPCCDAGIKPARGWTWINPKPFAVQPCSQESVSDPDEAFPLKCRLCPLGGGMPERAGLLWVGEKFYPTPADFTSEAARLGVSRRISQIPRCFKAGETWILFAHRKGILNNDGTHSAAIFHAFKPTEIQYVTTGKETEEELQALIDRGITPVKVQMAQGELPKVLEDDEGNGDA